MPLADRHGGIARHGFARPDIAHHAAFARDLGAVADRDMVADRNRAAHHDIIADGGGARHAGLAGEDAALADADIVADLHKVIERGHIADHRVAKAAAINGAIAADGDLVADHHQTDMREPHRALRSGDKAEAFAADADIGGNIHMAADQGMADAAIGPDHRIAADADMIGDHGIGADAAAGPDADMLADHHAGRDGDFGADVGGCRQGGAGMNKALRRTIRIKDAAQFGKGQARILAQKQGAAIVGKAAKFPAGNDDPGVAFCKGPGMANIAEDSDIVLARLFQVGNVVDNLTGALGLHQLGADFLRQNGERKWALRLKKSLVRHSCPKMRSLTISWKAGPLQAGQERAIQRFDSWTGLPSGSLPSQSVNSSPCRTLPNIAPRDASFSRIAATSRA